MRVRRFKRGLVLPILLMSLAAEAHGEEVKVRFPQGCAHGFVELTTADGTRIAVGDLLQRSQGNVVSSELLIRFFDGSLDDETTVFSQHGVFHFMSDHHVQRGPSFPQPMDVTIDAGKRLITSIDPTGHRKQRHFDIPADTYNGLASTLLLNVSPATPETRIAIVLAAEKPRIVHLSMKNGGEVPFTIGGTARKAIDYVVHVELGGAAGVVAPLIGKQPTDYHVWILDGPEPAFIREEGQLYEGGPVWRIQQISAELPK